MSDDDKVIRFPGAAAGAPPPAEDPGRLSPPGDGALGLPGLSADQEKAIGLVLSGMSFVCVGISPTATGADFYVAIDGRRRDLADARPHLGRVLDENLDRRGL